MKAKESFSIDGKILRGYLINCPGCGMSHLFDSRWSFNGDFEKPTFKPSMLAKWPNNFVCHSFVTDGKIQFLGDCTHENAGKTMDLLDV